MSDGRASSGPRILIRVDASAVIGGGHVMRCLSLADALSRRGARVGFVCALIPDALAARVAEAGYDLHRLAPVPELQVETPGWDGALLTAEAQRRDAADTLAVAGTADWIIVDHYRLAADWILAARGQARTLVIDDLANRPQPCDLLVDQTFGRRAADYAGLVPDGCRILAGARYAMLRPEFAAARTAALARREQPGPPQRLLVSLGTTDPGGITAQIVAAVAAAGLSAAIDVVVGAGAPSLPRLAALAGADPRIRLHVDTREMVRLTAEADLAIGAAGTSAWERCCLGLPTVTLVLAANQRLVAAKLHEAGAIAAAEDAAAVTPLLRRLAGDEPARLRMIAAAAAITAGLGSEIVARVMLGSAVERASTLAIRPARVEDARIAWLWRNDPATRAASQSHEPIAWPDHLGWWARSLASPDRHLLIATGDGDVPVAVLRFDRLDTDRGFEVSINLDPEARGGGLGEAILAGACEHFLARHGPVPLVATIHAGNAASRRIFEKVGFVRQGPLGDAGFERYVRPEGVDA